jgi:pimeloyl-ACP methyl ester carboxylesterase
MLRGFLCLVVILWSCAFLEGCRSFVIEPKTWDYNSHEIGYEVSRSVFRDLDSGLPFQTDDRDIEKTPILLLNGFGVGSFHQHRLIPRLLQEEEESRVIYCVDYLGQGRSWPRNCQDGNSPSEHGLTYSAET